MCYFCLEMNAKFYIVNYSWEDPNGKVQEVSPREFNYCVCPITTTVKLVFKDCVEFYLYNKYHYEKICQSSVKL